MVSVRLELNILLSANHPHPHRRHMLESLGQPGSDGSQSHNSEPPVYTFVGVANGTIVPPVGGFGFGWDSIFQVR